MGGGGVERSEIEISNRGEIIFLCPLSIKKFNTWTLFRCGNFNQVVEACFMTYSKWYVIFNRFKNASQTIIIKISKVSSYILCAVKLFQQKSYCRLKFINKVHYDINASKTVHQPRNSDVKFIKHFITITWMKTLTIIYRFI